MNKNTKFDIADSRNIIQTLNVNPLFPNNFVMKFYSNFLQFLSTRMPRHPEYMSVTSYQKAIDHLHKKNGDKDSYAFNYPSLVIQPGPIKLDERINNLWHSANEINHYFVKNHMKPYTRLGNLSVYPITNRFIMNFELIYLGESYLEITDAYMHLNRLFNNRYKWMENIGTGTLFLPDEAANYVKKEYGKNLIDMNNDIPLIYSAAYNRLKYGFPWTVNAHVKMTDSSDGSNYQGGNELPTFRMNASFEVMVQLPNHIVLMNEIDFNAVTYDLVTAYRESPTNMFNMTRKLNDNETILIHLYDFDPTFEITVGIDKIPEDIFVEYKAIKTHMMSGIESELDDSEFNYSFSDNKYIFNIKDIDSQEFVIDIIGVHS